MKSAAIKVALALTLAGAFAMSAFTLTGATAGETCIPQYDSSGAQVAPYC